MSRLRYCGFFAGFLTFRLHQSCWRGKAVAGLPRTPSRLRRSTISENDTFWQSGSKITYPCLSTYLHDWEFMIDEKSQDEAWKQQELNPEWVVIVVIGCTEFQVHQVQCSKGWANEDDFHECVVNANKCGEKIQISAQVDDGEQNLRLSRNA